MRRFLMGLLLLGTPLTAATAAPFAGKATLDLKTLNAELAQHPEARWSTRPLSAAELPTGTPALGLDSEQLAAATAIPDGAFATPDGLPTQLDWRDKDGINWLPPVRNQGHCGSCVAFAAVGAVEAMINISSHVADFDARFSEQDLFARIGNCSQGSNVPLAMAKLADFGVPDAACMPYTSGTTGIDQPASASCADAASRTQKIDTWRPIDATEAKAALQTGPIVTIMDIYDDLRYYAGGVYKHVTGRYLGGHAILIVGYDDSVGAWIVRNSWGPKWGESGYFRIAYDDISGLGRTNFGLSLTNNAYIKAQFPSPEATRDPTVLEFHIANPRHADMGQITYTLTAHSTGAAWYGSVDPQETDVRIDASKLPADNYTLKLSTEIDGQPSRPWYELLSSLPN